MASEVAMEAGRQIVRMIQASSLPLSQQALAPDIAAIVDSAIAKETERCALIVESQAHPDWNEHYRLIAAAIRASKGEGE